MRNYSSRKKGSFFQISNYTRVVHAIVAVLLSLVLLYLFTTQLVALANMVATPFHKVGIWFDSSEDVLPSYIRGVHSLRMENEQLKVVIAEYSQAQNELAMLQYDLDELYALLENVRESDRGIIAGVISAPPFSPYDVLVIDSGLNHGVLRGDIVYHHGNRAIGIVQKVFDNTSLVTLFTSSESQISAYLANAKIFINAYGMGGDVLRLSVPQDVPVSVGELVLLAGVSSGYLGQVEVIESNPSSAEKSAYIAPASSRTYRLVRVSHTAVSDMSRKDILELINNEVLFLLATSTPNEVEVVATSTEDGL